jgi:hypothetical protein
MMYDGEIAEVVVFDRQLDELERFLVREHLVRRYGGNGMGRFRWWLYCKVMRFAIWLRK